MVDVYGIFRPSLALELGLNQLKEKGFTGKRLVVVVLDPTAPGKQTLLDSMFRTDGMSLVDGIAMAATIGMVLGVIYGSLVTIGPVALGLIGMTAGGGVGYLLDRSIRGKSRKGKDSPSGEIVVAVLCQNETEVKEAEKIMKEHQATALGQNYFS